MYKHLSLLCALLIMVLARNALAEAKYYPVYNFDKVWGIAEAYYVGEEERNAQLRLQKIFDALKIPTPLGGSSMNNSEPNLNKDIDKYYSKTVKIEEHNFYILKDPKAFLKAWLGKNNIYVQVFTEKGTLFMDFPNVYVQEANECTDLLVIVGAEKKKEWKVFGEPLFGKLVDSMPKSNQLITYKDKFKRIKGKNIKAGYEIQYSSIIGNLTLSKAEDDREWGPKETLEFSSKDGIKSVKEYFTEYGKLQLVHPIIDGDRLLIPLFSNADLKNDNWFYDRTLYEIKDNKFIEIISSSLDQDGLSC